MTKIHLALRDAAEKLESISDSPRLDAELLMAHALDMERGAMLLRQADLCIPAHYDALIARRMRHEPVAYIIGMRDFWDLTLRVAPGVLIPRSDSETLIEAARDHFADSAPHNVLDLGTGSGALLLAALSLFPSAQGIGIDASAEALTIAKANAERLSFAGRAQFLELSWRADGWTKKLGADFDLILCNPPYIETQAQLARQVAEYEPSTALFAGDDGLDDYRRVIPALSGLLADNGVAILELGQGQLRPVSEIAKQYGFQIDSRRDLAGIARALILKRRA